MTSDYVMSRELYHAYLRARELHRWCVENERVEADRAECQRRLDGCNRAIAHYEAAHPVAWRRLQQWLVCLCRWEWAVAA